MIIVKKSLKTILMLFVIVSGVYIVADRPLSRKEIRYVVGSKVVMMLGRGSGGTGFFVRADSGATYIMTNYHICQLSDSNKMITVKFNGKSYQRRVIHKSKIHDLCLVENILDMVGLDVGHSPSLGDTITIVGHPKLNPLTVSPSEMIGHRLITVAYGSAYRQDSAQIPMIFLPTNMDRGGVQMLSSYVMFGYSRGGNSGSPIVDTKGRVVSVLFAGDPRDYMQSFGVPLTYIKELLGQY